MAPPTPESPTPRARGRVGDTLVVPGLTVGVIAISQASTGPVRALLLVAVVTATEALCHRRGANR